jgi:hypothetical protein
MPVAQALGQQLPEYVNIMESWVNDQEPLILRLSFKVLLRLYLSVLLCLTDIAVFLRIST